MKVFSKFCLRVVGLSLALSTSAQANLSNAYLLDGEECTKGKALSLSFPNQPGFSTRVLRYSTPSFYNEGRLIIIMPPTGGTNFIDRGYAEMFCAAGYNAVIIDRWTGMDSYSGIDSHQQELVDSEKALGLVMAYFRHSKVGVLGTSKGAIGASVITRNHLRRIDAIFLIAGGSPLHMTIARAGEKTLRDLRDERMDSFRLNSQAQYDRLIEDNITYSTIRNLPSHIKTGMIIATRDKKVPTSLQENLRSQWNIRKVWRIRRGHTPTILGIFNTNREIPLEFFNEAMPR